MSTIKVTNLSGRGGASPNLPDGAVVTGVATATTFSGTLDGSLKTTGTPTLGLGVTINASGVAISGVATAGIGSFTTVYGDGSNLTGVGETIAPWNYNPDVGDTAVTVGTGIGITFNKKVDAGSGTATLKIVNAGAAGTTIQSWGVSSCTFNANQFTMGSLVSDLLINQTYQVDIPSGFLVDSNETSYAGTAYTFTVVPASQLLWCWGSAGGGQLGQNLPENALRSSPVQVPGTNWGVFQGDGAPNGYSLHNIKQDGTLWTWGGNNNGNLGLNNLVQYSSPVQVGTDTTWSAVSHSYYTCSAIKTDGTLWTWGKNTNGNLGHNEGPGRVKLRYSSPAQVGSDTTWSTVSGATNYFLATKTDGTLWSWGKNNWGNLGQNNKTYYSSPVQIPGTTWSTVSGGGSGTPMSGATKTDGTLWTWGHNNEGELGDNSRTHRSSPVQIPGTTWSSIECGRKRTAAARTDGTLWSWGYGFAGQGGQSDSQLNHSSPVQIPGTTWGTNQNSLKSGSYYFIARRTDNTMWTWGYNDSGALAQANRINISSPVQVPGTEWVSIQTVQGAGYAIKEDTTP